MKIIKKVINTAFVLVMLFVAGNVNASVFDEVTTMNPMIKSTTDVILDEVGAEQTRTKMTIYESLDGLVKFNIRIMKYKNENLALLDVFYYGKEWFFIDYVTVGNGESLINIKPIMSPNRHVTSDGYVIEQMTCKLSIEDLEFMRNAKVIRAMSTVNFPSMMDIKNNTEYSLSFSQAIDKAIEFMNE